MSTLTQQARNKALFFRVQNEKKIIFIESNSLIILKCIITLIEKMYAQSALKINSITFVSGGSYYSVELTIQPGYDEKKILKAIKDKILKLAFTFQKCESSSDYYCVPNHFISWSERPEWQRNLLASLGLII